MVAVPPYVSPEQNASGRASGHQTQERLSRKSKLRETLELQTLIANDIRDQNTKPIIRAQLVRAWDTLEERLRIIRGRTKPGSRNISVREPHPSELKRLKSPPVQAHSSLYDYAQEQPASASPIVPPPPEPQA